MKKLEVLNFSGYFNAQSSRYRAQDVCNYEKLCFTPGINLLAGEIDSGGWGVSYTLSMWKPKNDDFIFTKDPLFLADDREISLKELVSHSCYMDVSHTLFKSNKPVRKMVETGIKKGASFYSAEELRDIFQIDPIRFERNLSGVGNEKFRCMAAISVAWGKSIFCFPWASEKMVKYYGYQLTHVMEQLSLMGKIVVVPFDISLEEKFFSKDSFLPTSIAQ